MRSDQRSKAFVLVTTSVQIQKKKKKIGEGRIYKTDIRALLVKLGLGVR